MERSRRLFEAWLGDGFSKDAKETNRKRMIEDKKNEEK